MASQSSDFGAAMMGLALGVELEGCNGGYLSVAASVGKKSNDVQRMQSFEASSGQQTDKGAES